MNHSAMVKKVCILVAIIGVGTAASAQAGPVGSPFGGSSGTALAMMPMGGMSGSSGMPEMTMDMDKGMMMNDMDMPMDSTDMDMMNMPPMPAAGNSAQLAGQLDSINALIRQMLSTAAAQGSGLSEAQTKVLGQLLENQSLLLKQLSAAPSMSSGMGMGMMGKM